MSKTTPPDVFIGTISNQEKSGAAQLSVDSTAPGIPHPIVIFVRPQAKGNIGAIARAMANFGAAELRLVIDKSAPQQDFFTDVDWGFATPRGKAIMENGATYSTLRDAAHDCQWIIGSSGKQDAYDKGYARQILSPAEALNRWSVSLCSDFSGHDAPPRWALVLGPEDHGLRADEIALCNEIIQIPTQAQAPSMNVAMSLGIMLYEWQRITQELSSDHRSTRFRPTDPAPERARNASAEHRESFVDYLISTLELTTFFKYPDQDKVRARIRAWLQKTPIPVGELLFGFEIVYQLRCWGLKRHESRNFLTRTEPHDSQVSSTNVKKDS